MLELLPQLRFLHGSDQTSTPHHPPVARCSPSLSPCGETRQTPRAPGRKERNKNKSQGAFHGQVKGLPNAQCHFANKHINKKNKLITGTLFFSK